MSKKHETKSKEVSLTASEVMKIFDGGPGGRNLPPEEKPSEKKD